MSAYELTDDDENRKVNVDAVTNERHDVHLSKELSNSGVYNA